jgi:redox-sensitive bicupin YhaK (pirin superfamily)
MKTYEFHAADSRGAANHGWLQSYHTFSFANYYNPARVHFGTLRVLNDDTVSGGMDLVNIRMTIWRLSASHYPVI